MLTVVKALSNGQVGPPEGTLPRYLAKVPWQGAPPPPHLGPWAGKEAPPPTPPWTLGRQGGPPPPTMVPWEGGPWGGPSEFFFE